MIHRYQAAAPRVHPTAFVEASAHVIGDVELAEDASVWFCAVLRGDVNFIRIGRGTNLQDGTVVHGNRGGQPTLLGDAVTVGHAARLHGCRIASHCLIGIGAIVLDGVEIGEESLVAAVRRPVGDAELDLIRRSAQSYIALKDDYLKAGATT